MITGFLHLHSALRWVALLLLVVTILDNLRRMYRPYNAMDNKLALFTLIAMHLQLVIGLVLWVSQLSDALSQNAQIMKEKIWRFFLVEHFLGMLLAITFVTVGYVRHKKQVDKAIKHRMIFGYYLLALILVLALIPWPFRELIGRGWF
ncbi:MAG: hypothetical protein ACK5XV_04335 [Flavobacteriales bacterium]|jgi:hypothetical protein